MSAIATPHPTKFHIHDQREIFSHSHTLISVFTERFSKLIQKDCSIPEGTLCPLRYKFGGAGSEKKVVCKELGWGFWDGWGRYYNFFPFKIMGNTVPASEFSLSEPYSVKN